MPEYKNGSLHKGHRDRVRARFEEEGMRNFEDHQALEMLLFYAIPQKDTNDLAHILINEYGSLANVFEAPLESLESIKGMGKNSAILIKMILELYGKYRQSKECDRLVVLDTREKLKTYFACQFFGYQHEVLMAAMIDNKFHLKKLVIISEGDTSTTVVNLRKLATLAMNLNATTVVLAHNHPQGAAAPSSADVETVRSLRPILQQLDITLADSIIVSGEDVYSMASKGRYAYLFK